MYLEDYISAHPESKQLINSASDFAKKAFSGRKRLSGRECYNHALNVADGLAEMKLDPSSVAVGFLHDVIEDTEVSNETLKCIFGKEIVSLIEGVTKMQKFSSSLTSDQKRTENIRKLIIATAKDIRVIFIKLFDRYDNLSDMEFLPAEKQVQIARETLEIYAPISHRLGIYTLKSKLEDMAFRILNPKEFSEISAKADKTNTDRQEKLGEITEFFRKALEPLNLQFRITSRPKNIYNIYRKMLKQNSEIDEIQDMLGIRIITDTVADCYSVLGVIHTVARPVPGTFTDYISTPKNNMYQSIHTSVVMENGDMVEIQIRTEAMHRICEYGIASHWRYKEDVKKSSDFEEKVSWLASILEWQKNNNPEEFLKGLKTELEFDQVFVFTPKGDLKSLPKGSTPVDFAYTVHTDIGNRCFGAKVNGKLVQLKYELQNGDIVEIQVNKNSHPSQDWLKFVKTPIARSKIKNYQMK